MSEVPAQWGDTRRELAEQSLLAFDLAVVSIRAEPSQRDKGRIVL